MMKPRTLTKATLALAMAKATEVKSQCQPSNVNKEDKQTRQSWSEISDLNMQCRVALVAATNVKNLLANKELTNKLTDLDKIIKVSNILYRDLSVFVDELDKLSLKQEQADRTTWGIVELLQLSEDYHNWLSKFQAIVLPSVVIITQAYDAASAS